MVIVTIDEKTPAGKRILNEIVKNPHIGQINTLELNQDNDSNMAGYVSVDEYFSKLRTTVRSKFSKVNSHEDL